MSGQEQNIKTGGTALQAGRDISIQGGLSPDQMTEIMVAIAKTTSIFAREALETAEARINEFRHEILKRFAEEGKADTEAFKDPDFQYLLGDAQEAVARAGDDAVRDTLVDIIAQRSLEKGRTRLAITLGEAATIAAKLTANEFATLSLAYLVRYTFHNSIISPPALANYIEKMLLPVARDTSRELSSFWHLQAQSCANVEMGEVDLASVFRQQYGGVLGDGFTREQLEAHLPDGKKNALDPYVTQCVNDFSRLQPAAINFNVFQTKAAPSGLSESELRNVWSLFEGTMTDTPERLRRMVPGSPLLFDLWANTPLKNLTLTSVGIAIGHANAKRTVGLEAPLNIWIK